MNKLWRWLFGCRHVYDPVLYVLPLRIGRYECYRCRDVKLPLDGVKEFQALADKYLREAHT